MSQPYHRGAKVPQPGKLDPSLQEFWVENPFDIARQGHNLSAFERKRAYLNVRGHDFLDISYLTGADGVGDGRCVVAGDFRNNGRLDLVLRQAGGGPLLLYENDFPQKHYLKVSLRGMAGPTSPSPKGGEKRGSRPTSNRLGIGARLVATVKGQPLVRELFPHNTFESQMPSIIHFGLGESAKVDRLEIRWPSGERQVLTDLAADRHIVVEEGKDGNAAVETIVPGQTVRP